MLFKKRKPKIKIKIHRKKLRYISKPKRPLLHRFLILKKKQKQPTPLHFEIKKPIEPKVEQLQIQKPVAAKKKPLFSWPFKKKIKPAIEKHEIKLVEPKIEDTELLKRRTYMKRNVNFSLFFLIILIMGSLVGLTSYYQNSYTKQMSSLKQKTEEFNTALQELRIKKTQLNETSYKLELESKSKEQLGDLYTSIKQEKEAVEADLQKTKDQLLAEKTKTAQLEIERASLKTELEDIKERLAIAEENIAELEDTINDLRAQKNDYENKFNACCGGDTSRC